MVVHTKYYLSLKLLSIWTMGKWWNIKSWVKCLYWLVLLTMSCIQFTWCRSPFRVIPRIHKDFLFWSPSKPLLNMTSIPTAIPVCLNCLPFAVAHALYATVFESPVTLLAIENNSEFHTTPLVHNYVRLYHNYTHSYINLTTTTTLPTITMQRWSNHLATMQFEVLQLLMLA